MIDAALWVVLAAVAAAMFSIVAYTLLLGIGPMPSSRAARAVVLELVRESVQGRADCELHELGAGWGTLAFALGRAFPSARVVAWERSPVPWLFCAVRRRLTRAPNVELRRADFFAASLERADVVVCYLFTGAMERLGPKLERELRRPGAVVVSNTFGVRGWTAETTRTLEDLYRTKVYRYVRGGR